jgi:hypothetical protein
MSNANPEDPRCPECGEPIGARAVYCMHCSADLTEERERADTDDDGAWDVNADAADGSAAGGSSPSTATPGTTDATATGERTLLDPEGLIDDTLTVMVGFGGGLVVGFVGTLVLVAVTESVWAFPVGIIAWLLATAYLVRRRTVQEAVAKAAYGVALVLVLVPLVAFSPGSGGGLVERVTEFGGLLLVAAVPAALAAGVGFLVSRFVPDSSGEE